MLKREPTPAGPITELFDRLHELHLHAGEPGVRQIATGIGRGVLSYTTVHNVFRGPRVPKWGNLELVVDQLGGDVEHFRVLWRAARLAELAVPGPVRSDHGPIPLSRNQNETPDTSRRFPFVMVTYRLPVRSEPDGLSTKRWNSGSTGAGPAMIRLVAARNGVWVGWSGRPGDGSRGATGEGIHLRLVMLSGRELESHYEGYCNSTLWPLYHGSIESPEFHRDWQEANRIVNQRFADEVARVAAPGAVVWVHDYQLQLVPAILRRQRPDLRIGFFLHIPFPSVEMFLQLPGRAETLRGLLGADLIGFQQQLGAQNFLRLVTQVLGLSTSANMIEVDGRRVVADAFPISVDVASIERIVHAPRTRQRSARIRAEIGNPATLFVGVDRLDYTKGIEQRLLAYGELLQSGQLSPDSSVFIQVVTLSREHLAKYAHLRERIERLAGHLNGSYGRVGHPPVHYSNQVLEDDHKVALYLAADVMIVTPLRDGMNLVSKEYVASRIDNRGVLVLSEFAGAAAELREAILVNPNDVDELKSAMLRAVAMSPAEQRQHMEAMRWQVRAHDVQAWISTFLTSLDRAGSSA